VGDLSPHFSRSEFRDKRTGACVGPDRRLVDVLERIRALTGNPLVITSGYRSPTTNRAVGGAKLSQHLYGRAADIPAGRATVAQAAAAGAVGIGERDGWAVHVDVRPGGPARWSY
jgi:uncharacterized protein YcbK (DUF882 family)